MKLLNGSGFELALTGGILTDGKVNLNSYFDGNNISYVDVIVGKDIPKIYTYDLNNLNGIVIIGSEYDETIDKLLKDLKFNPINY